MKTPLAITCALLLMTSLALPGHVVASATAPAEPAAVAETPQGTAAAGSCGSPTANQNPFVVTNPFEQAFEAIGCTASYNCVHGTILSCTGSVNGACIASGAHCGAVTCDGNTTRCPGFCVYSHHRNVDLRIEHSCIHR